MKKMIASIALLTCSFAAHADWKLDNDKSQLSFISIKKNEIAEINRFNQLEGTVDTKGNALVKIHLNSVNTNIPIRDQRMQEHLFKVNKYAVAEMKAKLDLSKLGKLAIGEVLTNETLTGELDLHGIKKEISAKVVIARLGEGKLLVTTQEPLIIYAQNHKLAKGVEKLREIAQLPSISNAVPVTFVLHFSEAK